MSDLNRRQTDDSGFTQRIAQQVYSSIQNTIGRYPAESGGIIACNRENEIIDFWYDDEAGAGKTRYIPSVQKISDHINHVWRTKNYQFSGITHSHPSYATAYPSPADIIYAEKILKTNGLGSLLLIILCNEETRVFAVNADHCKADRIIEMKLQIY